MPKGTKERIPAVIALLFAMLCIEETNEIFDTLSPMEIQQIGELPEGERRYLLSRIKNEVIPTRRDWSNLNTDEIFFAPTGIKISQVVDESSFIGYSQAVWVEGVDTSNLSDDDILDTKGMLFLCVGNKQYTTVLGASKTVMKVVGVRPAGALEQLRKIAEPRGFYVWGEGSENLVVAKYLSSSSRGVTVQSLAGKRTTIKRATLTAVDEEWVSKQEAAKKLEKESAK